MSPITSFFGISVIIHLLIILFKKAHLLVGKFNVRLQK